MLDPEGRVTSWNSGANRIKGYEIMKFGQPRIKVLFPSGYRRGQTGAETRDGPHPGRAEDEGWRIRKNGSRFWPGW